MRPLLFFALLIIISFQSCTENTGSWENGQISAGKREDFHKLNTQAFNYLKANDLISLKDLLSKELIDNTYTEKLVGQISNHLSEDNYSLFDEYYVVNKYKDLDTIPAKGTGINKYSLIYPGTMREMYIAFFMPKAGKSKYLIAITYAKYDYGWKISALDAGPYTINGKTAPELYKLAQEEYNKSYLIDALNNMALSYSCVRPTDIWIYPQEAELHDFYVKLINDANDKYKFPFIINEVPTKPKIIRVFNEAITEGSFPEIYYQSAIKLKDTTAIKKENALIQKVIGKIMPGIDRDKKYVLYSVFNKMPNGSSSVDHFDITQQLLSN